MSETEKVFERIKNDLDDYHKWTGKFGIAVMLLVLAIALGNLLPRIFL